MLPNKLSIVKGTPGYVVRWLDAASQFGLSTVRGICYAFLERVVTKSKDALSTSFLEEVGGCCCGVQHLVKVAQVALQLRG